jgi:hypothetical protein
VSTISIWPFLSRIWQLKAATTFGTSINYWNLVNSHWEPLIDPWTFSISVSPNPDNWSLLTPDLGHQRRDRWHPRCNSCLQGAARSQYYFGICGARNQHHDCLATKRRSGFATSPWRRRALPDTQSYGRRDSCLVGPRCIYQERKDSTIHQDWKRRYSGLEVR